jgi:hypothetical protein
MYDRDRDEDEWDRPGRRVKNRVPPDVTLHDYDHTLIFVLHTERARQWVRANLDLEPEQVIDADRFATEGVMIEKIVPAMIRALLVIETV